MTAGLKQLHNEELGFCVCGRSEENAKYVLDFLEILLDEMMGWCPPQDTSQKVVTFIGSDSLLHWYDTREFSDCEETFEQRKVQYCGNEQSLLFLLYWLDKEGHTEHGGSIYTSSISRKGVEIYGKYVGNTYIKVF